ncbi:MAG: tetratricopeptide repeat protein [bacterium]|nr:tetratricopeptide repeat protein [bacterium]
MSKKSRAAVNKEFGKLKKYLLFFVIALVCLGILAVYYYRCSMFSKLEEARVLLKAGKYDEAYLLLEKLDKKNDIVSNKYSRSMEMIASGNYDDAYNLLDGLDYLDSNFKRADILLHCSKKFILSKAEFGVAVLFGAYDIDGDSANGKEPIEWVIISNDKDSLLVISKYALDCQSFNEEYDNVTWETCSLRKWLNGPFFIEAFNQKEQNMIQNTVVKADENPDYNIPAGNDTNDKVFCLSILEAQRYFSSDDVRKCTITARAENYLAMRGSESFCWFWLRSPGISAKKASLVDAYGTVDCRGIDVNDVSSVVRPAIRIKL